MITLRKLIVKITKFGTNPNIDLYNNKETLEILLAEIYVKYLHQAYDSDEKEYDDVPDFDFDEILTNVKSNFPDFGPYSVIIDTNKLMPDVDISHGIGDEAEDLANIIKDLLMVKWRMDNTTEKDALFDFKTSMFFSSGKHSINLLKRLIERDIKW